MHPSLGSMTLSQLAFPGEGNLNFPWEKSHWDNTIVKKKKLEGCSITNHGRNMRKAGHRLICQSFEEHIATTVRGTHKQ